MALFSQSFNFGDDTLNNLVNIEKEPTQIVTRNKTKNSPKPDKENEQQEVIDESPTNKKLVHTSMRDRLKCISMRSTQRKLRKNSSINSSGRINEVTPKATSKSQKPNSSKTTALLNDDNSDFFNIGSQLLKPPGLKSTASKSNTNYSALFDSDFDISPEDIPKSPHQIETAPPEEVNISEMEKLFEHTVTELRMDTSNDISIDDVSDLFPEEIANQVDQDKGTSHINWEESIHFENIVGTEPVTEEPSTVEENEVEISKLDIENVTFVEPQQEDPKDLRKCKADIKRFFHNESIDTSFRNLSLVSCQNDSFQQRNASKLLNNTFSISASLSKIIAKSENMTPKSESAGLSRNIDVNSNLLSNWGLPETVLMEYGNKGIKEMFNWQTECLRNPKVLFELSNLVYSAPTSAGKTLVSELLMIKCVIERRKKAIMLLPFISVVREKVYYLQDLLTSSNIRVEGFFGGYNPPCSFDKIHIAICTLEKANSIVNRLLEQNKLDEIGTIVLDEVHLISDPSRGYILELLLSKILYACRKNNFQIQIITMSATLPNTELLQKWLSAELYMTSYRPVDLNEMIKIGPAIYDNKGVLIRKIDLNFFEGIATNKLVDQDNVAQLCIETIADGCSVIVFCPSKDWCETLCVNIAEFVYKFGKMGTTDKMKAVREKIKMVEIDEMKQQFRNAPSGLDSSLEKCLSYGCAFHHAGLTTDERDLIENHFKKGTIKVIIATSTLSSGVNLPARRVIIRTPLFCRTMMSPLTYKQMIGRAGRKGQDTIGESILICSDANCKVGKELVLAKLTPISSCLKVNEAHIKRALLEIIASGMARTMSDLELFVQCTLLWIENELFFQQEEDSTENPILKCIKFLIEYEFIRSQIDEETNEEIYIPTMLGNACLASSIPPGDGILLFSELQKSRQNFVLESELHAVYIVTPYSVAYQIHEIDWLSYLDLWEKLPSSMKRIGELIGIKESFLVRAMRGNSNLDQKLFQIHKRFYIALALYELINEIPISTVSSKYKCTRGLLQSLQQMASTFAGIVQAFCGSLNWQILSVIVSQFKNRLFFGINHELIDLMKITNLTSSRARALHNNGVTTLIELANSDVVTIENILYKSVGFDTEKRRENECDYDLLQRNKLRNIYVTGKSDLSVHDAAKLLISDARKYLEIEMGVNNINWSKTAECIEQNSNTSTSNESIPVNQNKPSKKRKSNESNCSGKVPKLVDPELLPQSSTKSEDIIIPQSQEIEQARNRSTRSRLRHQTTLSSTNRTKLSIELPEIIDIGDCQKVFNKFSTEILSASEISFSVGVEKNENAKKTIIGENLMATGRTQGDIVKKCCEFDDGLYISGIAIRCCKRNFFLNLQDSVNTFNLGEKIGFIKKLLSNENLIVIVYELKDQIQALIHGINDILINDIICKFYDPKICNWLMKSQTESDFTDDIVTFEKLMELHAPATLDYLKLCGRSSLNYSIGLNYKSSINARQRSVIEALVGNEIIQNQRQKFIEFDEKNLIWKHFVDVEMPIQMSLARMELCGFPIDHDATKELANNLNEIQKKIETEVFKMVGRKFNINSLNEMAKVLGLIKKPNEKISITKERLEEIDTPLSRLILQYRKIGATIAKTIAPIVSSIRNNRIYTKNVCHTATGRINMHEPSLQTIAKDFTIELPKSLQNKSIPVSCRNVFRIDERNGRCLISADFRQLELRILTHLSRDIGLMKIMASKEDVFCKMAAQWNHLPDELVTDEMRNRTKQICYALIYGMGNKSLSIVLKIDEGAVVTFVEKFHNTYPGLRRYTDEIIVRTRANGFIETLTGRRRYFPCITSDDLTIRAQTERQAVNTTIQGSAADIAKMAMLRMERNLKKYQNELNIDLAMDHPNSVNLVHHLHDELIYEVPTKQARQVAKILKYSMENCVKLKVPLPVKVKIGTSWGGLVEVPL